MRVIQDSCLHPCRDKYGHDAWFDPGSLRLPDVHLSLSQLYLLNLW